MFDDLRNAGPSQYYDEEPGTQQQEYVPEEEEESASASGDGTIIGLSPIQRFAIALILFLMTCVIGCFCLVVTEKISLPFF